MKTFPIISTENLVLRRLQNSDVNDIYEMRKNELMHLYTDTLPDKKIEDTEKYIINMNKGVDDNKWLIWAIEHKVTKRVIGTISIWNINKENNSAELGYGIIPNFQGKGYMKESLLKVIDYGFNKMNLDKLLA